MLTDAQYARVPGILREIVDHDRDTASIAEAIAFVGVIDIGRGQNIRQRRAARAELSAKASGLYGRVPLRGDTGPGRPTAMAA
ncbi:hypothetical protein [uncultured Methylobacterium sp.]|jgi:hypothetical protein|uniref:hypothetical protein n=1 Tax=uncultured Methylobacterium sp. TaxID=157278 RepID=UPI00261CF537|nr:hypothetical protein [uncultured Methylobacterium sp.]